MTVRFAFRRAAAFDVVGLGFNTFDHVCVVPRAACSDTKQRVPLYFQQPGGQIPTALVALQRWGLRTAYVGPFGDDEGGRVQRQSLQSEGVDISGSRVQEGVRSHTSFVFVDRVTGERTIHWHRPEELALTIDEIDPGLLRAGQALLMDADDIDVALAAARQARAAGVMVVLDVDEPGARTGDLLASTDVVIVAGDFPQRLTGQSDLRAALRRMVGMGPALAAATLGTGGALAYAARQHCYVQAFRVPVVDTTSAGDIFHAGFLYGLLRQWPLSRTLHFAAAAAALGCGQLGGRASIPSLEDAQGLAATR